MNFSKYGKIFGVGPVGVLIGLALLGLLWLLDRLFHHVEILSQPRPLRIVGLIFIGLWICWHIWCLKAIRQWWYEDRLCTTGPYKLVRHPLYAGGVWLGFSGIALTFNSWIILPLPILLYLVLSLLVLKEEGMMIAAFGEEYRRYAARTGRLFPRF